MVAGWLSITFKIEWKDIALRKTNKIFIYKYKTILSKVIFSSTEIKVISFLKDLEVEHPFLTKK
jgi:hypothetical protein